MDNITQRVKVLKHPLLWLRTDDVAKADAWVGLRNQILIVRDSASGKTKLRVSDGSSVGGRDLNGYRETDTLDVPKIISPTTDIDSVQSPMITATPFVGYSINGSSKVHAASRWLFYVDSSRAVITYDSGWVTDSLTTFDCAVKGVTLPSGSNPWVSVSYKTSDGLEKTSLLHNFFVI